MNDCSPLFNLHTIPFPFFSTHLKEPSIAYEKSCGSHRAEWSSSVCPYTQGPLLHRIQTKGSDMESVSGQLALKRCSTPEFLEFILSKGNVVHVKLCYPSQIQCVVPFLFPSSNSSFLPLLFLCHSWYIHASLATSHCGRNCFHLWIDFNSLLQASSQGCTDSATLGIGSALTDSEFSHYNVWWWQGERCKKACPKEAFLK